MTRSEEQIDAIEREIAYECACATSNKLTGKDEESERHVKRMGLLREVKDILLAEQKRSEGCALCVKHSDINQFSIDDGLLVDHSDYGDNNSMPVHCCPNCGRDLTEGESV